MPSVHLCSSAGTVKLKDARQRKKGNETRVNICLFCFYSLYVICCLTIFASAAAPLALTVKVLGPQAKCEGRCLKPSASSTGSCEHFFFFSIKMPQERCHFSRHQLGIWTASPPQWNKSCDCRGSDAAELRPVICSKFLICITYKCVEELLFFF